MHKNELLDNQLNNINGGSGSSYPSFGLGKNNTVCMLCSYFKSCTVKNEDIKDCEHYKNTMHC